MHPYQSGDNWDHREANEVVETSRQLAGERPKSDADRYILAEVHKALAAYSVVGAGSSVSNTYFEPQTVKLPNPLSGTIGPFYTNGSSPIDTGVAVKIWPIGSIPVKLRINGTIAAGDRAKPNDDGECVEDVGGGLLCVSNTSSSHANFIAAPSVPTPNITFQAPSGGIPAATSFEPGSATVDILVRDTSDDEWKSSGTATVYSFADEAICADGLRLGWAFFDGSNYVAISRLCSDDRTYADADTL